MLLPSRDQDQRRWMALARMRKERGDMWPHIERAIGLLDARADLHDMLPAAELLLRIHDPRQEKAIYAVADRYSADVTHPSLAELFRADWFPTDWRCLRAPDENGDPGDTRVG